jgi:T-complex protein 1 subunit zeta
LAFLETFKVEKPDVTKELLLDIAKTSLMTKIHPSLANPLTEVLVEAVLTIKKDDRIDLHMIEIMHMQHKMSTESKLIKGLVLDHGARHPSMPTRLENCYIMTLNVSLEYEKTEVHSGFFWSSAD